MKNINLIGPVFVQELLSSLPDYSTITFYYDSTFERNDTLNITFQNSIIRHEFVVGKQTLCNSPELTKRLNKEIKTFNEKLGV